MEEMKRRGRKPAEPMPKEISEQPAWYDRQIEATKKRIDKLNDKVAKLEADKTETLRQINNEKYKKLIDKIESSNIEVDQWEKFVDEHLKK